MTNEAPNSQTQPASNDKNKLPKSVEILGALTLGFGVMGIVGIGSSLLLLFHPEFFFQGGAHNRELMNLVLANGKVLEFSKVTLPFGGLFAVLGMVAGFGFFQRKAWARKLALSYAILGLVLATVSGLFQLIYVLLPLAAKMGSLYGPAKIGAISGLFGGAVGQLFAFIYPLVLLIFLNRKSFIESFEECVRAAQESS